MNYFFLGRWPLLLAGLLVCLGINSCNGSADCACEPEVCDACAGVIDEIEANQASKMEADPAYWHQLIADFHAQSSGFEKAAAINPTSQVYLDFSSGMRNKIGEVEDRAGLVTDLVNVVAATPVQYFRLRDEPGKEIESLPKDIGGDIRSYIRDVNNYNAINNYAPLDVAFETIVAQPGQQAILITDGELARSRISAGSIDPTLAWATKPIKSWLEGGNRLDFVVADVKEERLFFIFFTPRVIAERNDNLISAFLTATRDMGKQAQYTHLKFTTNDFRLEQKDDGRPQNERGLNSSLASWIPDYGREVNLDAGYSHMHIFTGDAFREYLWDFVSGTYDEDFLPELREKNKLFYDLIFTNEFVNYQVADLEIKVENIGDGLYDLMDYRKCRQSKPTQVQMEVEAKDGEFYLDTLTAWCNPVVGCEDTSACKAPAYSTAFPEVPELFSLHENTSISTDANQFNTANIAIRPAKNYNPDAIYNTWALRINVYINAVTYDVGRQEFDKLKWQYKGQAYTGLSESVRLAMNELKPENRQIFSYYLTLYPQ